MKKFVLLSLLVSMMPVYVNAQDDMYFSPKKDKTERQTQVKTSELPTYYSGSNRNVDEYNRRGLSSYYQTIDGDTTANDVIDFYGNTPDSLINSKNGRVSKRNYDYDEDDYDYAYSRRMRYFDDFFWYDDPWLYGYPYYGPYYGYYGYGWGRPWRYGYYGYAGWYDPWYYGGWYGGWYDPWYYGWNRPYWGTVVAYRPYNRGGVSGSANHGWVDNGRRNGATGFSGYRGSTSTSSRNTDAYNRQSRNNGYSGYRGSRDNNAYRNESNNGFSRNDNFSRQESYNQSGYRNESTYNSGSFNRANSNSSFGGGNFGGGSRGGGFSGGGSRSGGGGHFGGRR